MDKKSGNPADLNPNAAPSWKERVQNWLGISFNSILKSVIEEMMKRQVSFGADHYAPNAYAIYLRPQTVEGLKKDYGTFYDRFPEMLEAILYEELIQEEGYKFVKLDKPDLPLYVQFWEAPIDLPCRVYPLHLKPEDYGVIQNLEHPLTFEGLGKYGLTVLGRGRYQTIIEQCDPLLKINPLSMQIGFVLGIAHGIRGQLNDAIYTLAKLEARKEQIEYASDIEAFRDQIQTIPRVKADADAVLQQIREEAERRDIELPIVDEFLT
jgi:hypothetical protein